MTTDATLTIAQAQKAKEKAETLIRAALNELYVDTGLSVCAIEYRLIESMSIDGSQKCSLADLRLQVRL